VKRPRAALVPSERGAEVPQLEEDVAIGLAALGVVDRGLLSAACRAAFERLERPQHAYIDKLLHAAFALDLRPRLVKTEHEHALRGAVPGEPSRAAGRQCRFHRG